MPLSRSFKTDESFLEKIAIGATGTRRTFDNLHTQGHQPIELERGSMSFKIWKSIKIKRIRVPDILCLRCGGRVESRAKTKMEISMSHSLSDSQRGWDYGLFDRDHVSLVQCGRVGPGPLDWSASTLVQYAPVAELRAAWAANRVRIERPKGAQEGFETRVTWPAAITSADSRVDYVDAAIIRLRRVADGRATTIRMNRQGGTLTPLVAAGDTVSSGQIVAAVVPVGPHYPCPAGATVRGYAALAASSALSDRYTAVKALGHYSDDVARATLATRVADEREHIYVRVDAAAGLMRREDPVGSRFLAGTLQDPYLENRLEAVIVLSEVGTTPAANLLIATVQDTTQNPEIRAGAAWSLGELGARQALPALIDGFGALETVVKMEAARALAKLARRYLTDVLHALPAGTPQERPGIAWALGKAGGFRIDDILAALVDDDARQWVTYVIGTQQRDALLPGIERLAHQDPEVYFAVTVLWKIFDSWVYGLEEY